MSDELSRINAAVDEKVFGHRVEWSGNFAFRRDVLGDDFQHGDLVATCHTLRAVVPEYSTDIAEAWRVFDHIGGHVTIHTINGGWACRINDWMRTHCWAETPALAICRSALAAVTISKSENIPAEDEWGHE